MNNVSPRPCVEDLAWYFREQKYWWPVVLQKMDPRNVDAETLTTSDYWQYVNACMDRTDLFQVTILGTSESFLLRPHEIDSAQGYIQKPFGDFIREHYVATPERREQVFGAERAAEFKQAVHCIDQILADHVAKRNGATSGDDQQGQEPAAAAVGPRRISMAEPAAAKARTSAAHKTPQDEPSKYVADCNHSSGKLDIGSDDDWRIVWDKMDWAGWEKVGEVYVKPGVNYFPDNRDIRRGIDYFASIDDLQDYIRQKYNWEGPKEAENVEPNLFLTPPDQPTIAQDPGKPLLSTAEKELSPAQLRVNRSAKLKKTTISKPISSRFTKRLTKEPTKSVKQAVVAVSKPAAVIKKESVFSADKSKKSNKKQLLKLSPDWWLKNPVPSSEAAWLILEKLGYTSNESEGCFELPPSLYADQEDSPMFNSLTGLRKFLCKFGVPSYKASLLSTHERMELQRWVTFANVPVSHENSLKVLKEVSLPSNGPALASLLASNGFSMMDGKVWAPNYRHGKKASEFIFDLQTDQTRLKVFIRGAWTMDSNFLSMEQSAVDSPASKSSVVMSPPPAKYSERISYEKYLALRLWAATSEEQLPQFSPSRATRKLNQVQLLEMLLEDYDEIEPEEVEEVEEEESIAAMSQLSFTDETVPRALPKAVKAKSVKKKDDLPWWQTCPLPSQDKAWSILAKLGYIRSEAGYGFPPSVYKADGASDKDHHYLFQSLTGLRKFLCKFGIPYYKPSAISSAETTDLDRWVRFANVPVSSHESVRVLSNVSKPKTKAQLSSLLTRNGFSTVDGKFWAPGYKSAMKNCGFIFSGSDAAEGEDGSRLKRFIRGSWTLDSMVLTGYNYGTSPPTAKYRNSNDDAHLQLRLWAAASSDDLPSFKHLPRYTYELVLLEKVQENGSVAETDLSEDESHQESLEDTQMGDETSAQPSSRSDAVDEGRGRVAVAKSSSPSLPWYYQQDTSFLRVNWKTLQDMGFFFVGSTYHHPKLPALSFDDVESLRKFMCKHGIPDIGAVRQNLSPSELDTVVNWIRIAHVPIKPTYFSETIKTLEPLSDVDALDILVNIFGFKIEDDKVFPPASYASPEPVHGLHFLLKDEIAPWLRAREEWIIDGDPGRRFRYKTSDETEKFRLKIRLWAAACDDPLPGFFKVTAKRGHSSDNLTELHRDDSDHCTGEGDKENFRNSSPKRAKRSFSSRKHEPVVDSLALLGTQPGSMADDSSGDGRESMGRTNGKHHGSDNVQDDFSVDIDLDEDDDSEMTMLLTQG